MLVYQRVDGFLWPKLFVGENSHRFMAETGGFFGDFAQVFMARNGGIWVESPNHWAI